MSEEEGTNPVGSPWGKLKNCDVVTLRQPKISGGDLSVTSSKVDGDSAEAGSEKVEPSHILNINDKIINSKLNANAAEFIPICQKNQLKETTEEVLTYLRNELNCLTLCPEKYEEISEALCEVLKEHLEDDNVMKPVIDVIIDQCINEPNLRYNGVRLCSKLNELGGSSFITLLLTCCEEEHSNFTSIQPSTDTAYLNRICGFALVLAELFLQIQISGECIVFFGEALLGILQIVLTNESEMAIKSVCQVLKLTGTKLENISNSSSNKLDGLFSGLEKIFHYVDLDPNLRLTIRSVLEMRNSNWGQNMTEPTQSEEAPVDINSFDDPVFFGPDGKVISEEETCFLHDNIPLSEDADDYVCEQDDGSMDEEVCKDFEEFLRTSVKEENKKE